MRIFQQKSKNTHYKFLFLYRQLTNARCTQTMTEKTSRIAAIDILRCIAIIGMVLSSNIGFSSGLPGWMFHAQTPPPTYAFNPENVGLTWVDLVFPFFLFSMGAALPFSMRKKISRGASIPAVCSGIVKRWITLTLFAIVLGNAYRIGAGTQPEWAKQLFKIAVWVAMCLTLMRVPGMSKKLHNWLNASGIILLVLFAFTLKDVFGVGLNTGSDVIIMILAEASLTGGLIWLLTRDSLKMRWAAIAVIAGIKAVFAYIPQAVEAAPAVWGGIGWFFQWSYLQYLIPVLVGSVIGDMLLRAREHSADSNGGKRIWAAASLVCGVTIIIQLWGLYTRHIVADLALTAALAAIFAALTWKHRHATWVRIGFVGMALTLAGIAFDPIDGGIAKDYCNLSYLLTTSGLGTVLAAALLSMEQNTDVRSGFLSAVGQNPMIAYTITGFVIGPILVLTGILPQLWQLAEGSVFWGLTEGIIITLLMMLCTALCTRVKLFWRS